jgi:phosphotransferase system IIB component
MRKITKLTRAKRNLIVEEVSKSYSNYKKYQNLATKYAIVNDRTKVFTSYNKIQQEIKKLLTELNGNYKVIVGNRKVELIMMDENNKIILTKSIIVYKNKTEIKSTARTNRTDLKFCFILVNYY